MHIIVVSKLYKGDPSAWLRQINELKKEKKSALAVYAPLRNAILEEILRPGTGNKYLMSALRNWKPTPSLAKIRATSERALESFRNDIADEISMLGESFLSRQHPTLQVAFFDPKRHGQGKEQKFYKLEGRFHFSYMDSGGNWNLAFIHCSDWTDERIEGFVELLSIFAEAHYAYDRKQVAFLDLSKSEGRIVRPGKRSKTVRRQLADTLHLLAQIQELSADVLSQDGDF